MAPRRRLRLVHSSSSDEEEQPERRTEPEQEQEQEQPQLVGPTQIRISSNPNPYPNPIGPPPEINPYEISDEEDFEDVAENFSSPSPPPIPIPPTPIPSFQDSTTNSTTRDATSRDSATATPQTNTPVFSNIGRRNRNGCSIDEFLWNRGLRLRGDWLDSCISGLSNAVPGFTSLNVADKAKMCFEQFLFSDMNLSGSGVLPQNVHSMNLVDLAGPFVLQVDEIVNMSCPLRDRYQNANAGIKRCLKLCMTDGVQRVYGMEYRPIKDLEVLAPAGLKVIIRNVHVRRGLLMLVPEVLEVLGGVVENLDAARQRLVEEVNKPPRGKRTRTGVVPPLASRATLAAWPPNGVSDNGNADNLTSHGTMPTRSSNQGVPYAAYDIDTRERHTERSDVPLSTSNVDSNPSFSTAAGVNEINMADATAAMSGIGITEPTIEVFAAHNERSARAPAAMSRIDITEPTVEEFSGHNDRSARVPAAMSRIDIAEPTIGESGGHNERRPSAEPTNLSSNAVPDVGDIDMIDEVEDQIILTGDKEVPFTYLASLLAKWSMQSDDTPSIQGTIKCFLTGVKGFQFKNRTTFELQVYVDDGSLIAEVCIDHNVVQKAIGYSPEQVTAAIASSDSGQMKETLRQFQMFLVNFEGTMLVEMNKSSSLPVAIEMNQGCSTSDAWLLLRRLNMFTSPHTPRRQHLEPITISP